MADDFNTPKALSVLFDLAREINQLRDTKQLVTAKKLATMLKYLGSTLGLLQEDPTTSLKSGVNSEAIETLIMERSLARQNKNWQEADKIRDKLTAMGITLEDTKDGTTWIIENRKKL